MNIFDEVSKADVVISISKSEGIKLIKNRIGMVGDISLSDALLEFVKYANLDEHQMKIIITAASKLEKLGNFA